MTKWYRRNLPGAIDRATASDAAVTSSATGHTDRWAAFRGRVPWIAVVVLLPSWFSWLVVDRDLHDTGHPLFYHIPDLTRDPLALLLNLTVTPLINTETDQILLVTVLIAGFGVAVERCLGTAAALGLFWGTSAAGALVGGLLLHLLYPLFPDVEAFQSGWNRVFNGASAGGFGLMGAHAATAARPVLWIALFCSWEPAFWFLVSRDYTSAFHMIAFTTGFATARRLRRRPPAGRDDDPRRCASRD